MNDSNRYPIELTENQKLDILKMRFKDQVDLLRTMTKIDLQVFGGYITIQLLLAAWLGEHPPANLYSKCGIFLIDSVLG